MRIILALIFIIAFSLKGFSQDIQKAEMTRPNQVQTYLYAYISIEGKAFSRKLKVQVDIGDTPQQIKDGKEYSDSLTNKKSYAAVLNYMAERQFELVETRDDNFTYQGIGGTSGIVFIMRKRNN